MKLASLKPRLSSIVTTRLPSVQHTDRLRGRAAVTRRARWLDAHPLCVECDKAGRVTAGSAVDHIVPLWKGGADDYETNGQTLCDPCHEAKTTQEAAERAKLGS